MNNGVPQSGQRRGNDHAPEIDMYVADRLSVVKGAAALAYARKLSWECGFSRSRMIWIKPNFLWMMYRNGWGTKEGQEVVLAIHLKLDAFKKYIENSEYSSFGEVLQVKHDDWKSNLDKTEVRLQCDPDHNSYGEKIERRAIQIGIKGSLIASYATEDILEIEDVSDFVKEQIIFVQNKKLDSLVTPTEKPFFFDDSQLNHKLKLL